MLGLAGARDPGPALRRVAGFAARRARVSQSMFFTDRTTASLMELGDGDPGVLDAVEHMEMIYDGANAHVRSVTRYRLTIDLGRADAALPAGVSVPAGPYRALSRLPAEVWLDAEGVARRISVGTDPSGAADKQVWSIVELWDFGVPASITPPAPGEILSPEEASRLAEGDPPPRNP